MPPLSAYPAEQRDRIEEMQRKLQPIPATGAGAPAQPQRDRA